MDKYYKGSLFRLPLSRPSEIKIFGTRIELASMNKLNYLWCLSVLKAK